VKGKNCESGNRKNFGAIVRKTNGKRSLNVNLYTNGGFKFTLTEGEWRDLQGWLNRLDERKSIL